MDLSQHVLVRIDGLCRFWAAADVRMNQEGVAKCLIVSSVAQRYFELYIHVGFAGAALRHSSPLRQYSEGAAAWEVQSLEGLLPPPHHRQKWTGDVS